MTSKEEKKQPLLQLINDDDMSWVRSGQQADINKITGDEMLASKSAHSAHRFKQNMIYNSRKTNKNTHKKHFEEELNFHSTRKGWWDAEYDEPLEKNLTNTWFYIR
jgi:hypothetical protein